MTKPTKNGLPSHRAIIALAVPIMVSNVSTPLLGVVDTAVVGRLPGPHYVGAVALGSLVFGFVYWAFGFLRMGTTGLTAQALGSGDADEVRNALVRALLIAGVVGAVLFFCGPFVRAISLGMLEGSARVEGLAADYIDLRIRSAPATFANYALLGWFVGLGKTRIALVLQLILNGTNMVLDAVFVLVLHQGVRGVAAGTVIAEWLAALIGLAIAWRHLRRMQLPALKRARVLDRARMKKTLLINFDIMVRSMLLVGVFLFFMARGASMGDLFLAANAVLMHFVELSAYFLDGLAHAAQTLVGQAIGRGSRAHVRHASIRTTLWAGVIAAGNTFVFLLFGPEIVALITTDEPTRIAARDYQLWAALAPLMGVWCFQLDGIFIGATRGAAMRNSMLISTAIFITAWWLLREWANHGLWAAFYVFYVARALTLAAAYPALERSATAPQKA